MIIDYPALGSINHKCRPGLCKAENCCCANYDIIIEEREADMITGLLPLAAEFAPHLRDGDGYLNVFEQYDGAKLIIDCDDRGICIFAYDGPDGGVLCSLHSVALQLGKPPAECKPSCCITWPLAIVDRPKKTLTIDADVLDYPCNSSRNAEGSLCPEIAEIVGTLTTRRKR